MKKVCLFIAFFIAVIVAIVTGFIILRNEEKRLNKQINFYGIGLYIRVFFQDNQRERLAGFLAEFHQSRFNDTLFCFFLLYNVVV